MPNPQPTTHDVVIQSQTNGQGARAGSGKTRSFRAALLALTLANDWQERLSASTARVRPAVLRVAGSDAAMRAVVANLRTGEPAALVPTHLAGLVEDPRPDAELELLKSAGYRALSLALLGGPQGPVRMVTLYLPELVTMKPNAIDRQQVSFVAPCPTWWVEQQAAGLDPALVAATRAHLRALGYLPCAGRDRGARLANGPEGALRRALVRAVHTLAYLRARSRSPVPLDAAFAVQVYLSGLEARLLTLPHPFHAYRREGVPDVDAPDAWAADSARPGFATTPLGACGEEPPVGCHTTHAVLDRFFAAEVALYYRAQAALAPERASEAVDTEEAA